MNKAYFPSPRNSLSSQEDKHITSFIQLGLPWWLSGKESSCQCRRRRRLGRAPGEGNGNGILAWKTMDRGAWKATIHGVAEELDTT